MAFTRRSLQEWLARHVALKSMGGLPAAGVVERSSSAGLHCRIAVFLLQLLDRVGDQVILKTDEVEKTVPWLW